MTQRQNSLLWTVYIFQIKKKTRRFESRLCLRLQLVDPLDRAILSHWAPQKQSTEKEILSVTENFNNIYLLQLGYYPVAVVILHVNKT